LNIQYNPIGTNAHETIYVIVAPAPSLIHFSTSSEFAAAPFHCREMVQQRFHWSA